MLFKPKHSADYRTLLWVFGFTPGLVALLYWKPTLIPYLFWLSALLAITCGVIAHNHNHKPTFADKGDNRLFANWISVFYGYPVFAWVPTHNSNHHRYVNRPGDATITWRHTRKHVLWVMLTYFFVSAYYQGGPIGEYIKKAKEGNRELYNRIRMQYVSVFGGQAILLGIAIALHGLKMGVFTWFFAVGLPAGIALWSLMFFNYEQHVNMDPFSKYDHSRNFTSPTLNFLLFNNGYHAAHHDFPNKHWSELKVEHEKLAPFMSKQANETSLWWYLFRQYFIAPFVPSMGSKQIGPGPWSELETKKSGLETASVDAVEAGTNAERLVDDELLAGAAAE